MAEKELPYTKLEFEADLIDTVGVAPVQVGDKRLYWADGIGVLHIEILSCEADSMTFKFVGKSGIFKEDYSRLGVLVSEYEADQARELEKKLRESTLKWDKD